MDGFEQRADRLWERIQELETQVIEANMVLMDAADYLAALPRRHKAYDLARECAGVLFNGRELISHR